MAKHNLAEMTIPQLLNLIKADPGLMVDITTEIERRNNPQTAPSGPMKVEYNSAGQVFLMETTPTCTTKTGGLKCGQCNVDSTMMTQIVAETDTAAELRKSIRELLSMSPDEKAKQVNAKKEKKQSQQEKAVFWARRELVKNIGKGLMPKSALEEFDKINGTSDSDE